MKPLIYPLYLLVAIFSLSCSNSPSGNQVNPGPNPQHPDSISDVLGDSNPTWVRIDDTLPSPSGTLEINSSIKGDTVIGIQERRVEIPFRVLFGDTTGIVVLFQVAGSNSYFELSANKSGRLGSFLRMAGKQWQENQFLKQLNSLRSTIQINDTFTFPMEVSGQIPAGVHPIKFAARNQQGEVSNHIEFNLNVVPLEGSMIEHLSSHWWKLEKSVFTIHIVDTSFGIDTTFTEVDYYGVKYYDTSLYHLACPGGGFGNLEVIEWYINNQFIRFYANSEAAFEEEIQYHELDFNLSNCLTGVYEDGIDTDIIYANWFFDAKTNLITINYYGYYDDTGYYYEPYSESIKIESQGPDRIIISIPGLEDLLGEGTEFRFHMIPK